MTDNVLIGVLRCTTDVGIGDTKDVAMPAILKLGRRPQVVAIYTEPECLGRNEGPHPVIDRTFFLFLIFFKLAVTDSRPQKHLQL